MQNKLTGAGILHDVVHRQQGMNYRGEREFPDNFNKSGLHRVRLVFPYKLTESNDDWNAMKKVFGKLRDAMEDDRGKGKGANIYTAAFAN